MTRLVSLERPLSLAAGPVVHPGCPPSLVPLRQSPGARGGTIYDLEPLVGCDSQAQEGLMRWSPRHYCSFKGVQGNCEEPTAAPQNQPNPQSARSRGCQTLVLLRHRCPRVCAQLEPRTSKYKSWSVDLGTGGTSKLGLQRDGAS
ncbi:hypothetical protein NDU88_008868 [Pleurodeles waltl]|uniref:Uncharacterized protein n=1 Tax=Pleurodeles waltl TaxID=8319 RepID=A0AAV7N664_PLEWA|nr:hypothetical protein NDU88_008868 [Pleurodeles waltl]